MQLICEKIARSSKSKTIECWKTMLQAFYTVRQNDADLQAEKDKIKNIKSHLIREIVKKQISKQLLCYVSLRSNHLLIKNNLEMKELRDQQLAAINADKRHRLIQALIRSQEEKIYACHKILVGCLQQFRANQKLELVQSEKEVQGREAKKNGLLTLMVKAQFSKLAWCYKSMIMIKNRLMDKEAVENLLERQIEKEQQITKQGLIKKLVKAQQAKEKDCLKNLRAFNLRAKNEEKFSSNQNRIAQQEINKKRSNLVSKLVNSYQRKRIQSFKNLSDHSQLQAAKEKIGRLNFEKDEMDRKAKLQQFISKLCKAQEAKKIKALKNLQELNLKISKDQLVVGYDRILQNFEKTNIKKTMLNSLLRAQESKILQAVKIMSQNMRKLRHTEVVDKTRENLNELLRKKLIGTLVGRLESTLAQSYYRLKENGLVFRSKSERSQKIRSHLILKLVKAQEMKIRESYLSMARNSNLGNLGEQGRNKMKAWLLKKLCSSLVQKTRESFNRLSDFSNSSKSTAQLQLEKTRRVLENILGFASQKKRQEVITCYIYMKLFADRQRAEEWRSRKLIQSIINGCRAKQKHCMSNMRTFNLAAWNQDRLNQTLLDIQVDKDIRLKHKLFKNIMRAQAMKALMCLRKMKYLVKFEKEQEERCKEKLNFFVLAAKGTGETNVLRAYRLMVDFSRRQKELELKVHLVTFKINTWMTQGFRADLSEALRRLRAHNQQSNLNDQISERLKKRLATLIVNSQQMRLRLAIQKFKSNRDSLLGSEQTKSRYGKILREMFVKSKKNKVMAAYQIMIEYANRAGEVERRKRAALGQMVLKLQRSTHFKLIEALGCLRQNNRFVDKNSQKRYESGRKLTTFIKLSSDNLVLQAFLRLRAWNNKCQTVDKKKREIFLGLLRRLQVAQQAKLKRSLENLWKVSIAVKKKEQTQKSSISRLVQKLISRQTAKTSHALSKFQTFNDGVKLKQLEQNTQRSALKILTSKNQLVSNLVHAYLKKYQNGFSKLLKYSKSLKEKDNRLKLTVKTCLLTLVKAQRSKCLFAFSHLKNVSNIQKDKNAKLQNSLKTLFSQLVLSQKKKQSDAISKLKQNKIRTILDGKKRTELLRSVFNRLTNSALNQQRQTLQKLRGNNMARKGLQDKLATRKNQLVLRLVSSQTQKQRLAFKGLQKNYQKQKESKATKESKLANFLAKFELIRLRNQRLALERLSKNSNFLKKRLDNRKSLQLRILNKLALAQKAKQLQTFLRLKTTSQFLKNSKTIQEKKLVLIMIMLVNAQKQKLKEANSKLRNYGLTIKNITTNKQKLIASLLKRLSQASQAKKLVALSRLKFAAKDLKDLELKRKRDLEDKKKRKDRCLKSLIDRLQKSYKSDTQKTVQKLASHARQFRESSLKLQQLLSEKQDRKDSALKLIIGKISRAAREDKIKSLNRITEFARKDKEQQNKWYRALCKVILLLSKNADHDKSIALGQLQKNSITALNADKNKKRFEQEKQKALRRIINQAQKKLDLELMNGLQKLRRFNNG